MKKAWIVFVAIGVTVSACQQIAGYFDKDSKTTEDSLNAKAEGPMDRDLSITAENAYSDLFLDTSAVENYIREQNLSGTEATAFRNFYNRRNFQYAWFSSNGITEQGRGFWNLREETDSSNDKSINKALQSRMDTLLEKDTLSIIPGDSSFAKTELGLTHQFILYSKNNSGKIDLSNINYFMPVRKYDALQLADSILKRNDTAYAGSNKAFAALKQQLAKYYAAAQGGGWQPIMVNARQIKKGSSSPAIAAIKKRLQLTGDYSVNDTTQQFNDSLFTAIKSYQKRVGLDSTGMITDSLIKILNVPAVDRIQQIIVNMNRIAWMQNAPANYIQVNIPSFVLYTYEGGKKAFDMEVIVGKDGTNTMMFSGDLNQVVFSPHWNVPESIVKNEIMPAMKKDPSYLKKNNMEIVKQNDSIPVIRQLPGGENSLGKVKFLFPNSYDIFFHDTPAKNLFDRNKRAFSHGCIRLADAEKMAQYVLRDDPSWTPEKIKAAMNSGKEQFVKVKSPIPVLISYYTAWVDDEGRLNFRDDIYGHDKQTATMMFLNPGASLANKSLSDTTKADSAKIKAKP